MPTPRPRSLWRDAALLTALCLVVYCFAPVAHGLTNWQEAQRALVAREMLARGEWLVPTVDGRAYLAKPPLFYWVQMSLATIRGSEVTELDLRLAAALGGLLGVLATWFCALQLLAPHPADPAGDETRPDHRAAALVAAACLATGILSARSARIGELDIYLIPFTAAAVGLIFRAWTHRLRTGRTAFLSVAGVALCAVGAILTKGPPGVLMIALGGYGGLFLAALRTRAVPPGRAPTRRRALWHAAESTHFVGTLGLAALAFWGWGRLVAMRIGGEAVRTAAVTEAEDNLRIFVPQAPLRNLEALSYGVGLGSILAALCLVWLLKDRPRLRAGWIVALAWVGLGFVAFSVLGKGVARYLTPVWPGVAVLGGLFAAQWLSTARNPRGVRVLLVVVLSLLGVGQAVWYGPGREHFAPHRSPRALVAELTADPALDALPMALVGFDAPAVAFYRGAFPLVFDSNAPPSITAGRPSPGLKSLAEAARSSDAGLLALVLAPDGPETAQRTLEAAGMSAEPVRTEAAFAARGGKTPVAVFLVRGR